MGTSVSVQQAALQVEPGATAVTELRVRNTGTVVDQFSFQPLGEAAAWVRVDPPTVRLFPDTDENVRVTIAPPRDSSSTPGVSTWAVKVVPQEDPAGASVAEGTVDVGTFVEVGAELQPTTGRGRLTGRFDIAIDNHGNLGLPVRINGTDPEQALRFEVTPTQLDAAPGSAQFAKLRVKPTTRMWRGQPKARPFQLLVEPQGRTTAAESRRDTDPDATTGTPLDPIVVNGTLLQEPILPKWLLKALLILLALLLLLFVLWKTLLKPTVESAAREVAIEEVAPVSSLVDDLQPAVEEATQQAAQASEQAADAEESAAAAQDAAESGGGSGGLGTIFNETSAPSNFRLEVAAAPGASAATPGEANGADTTFALTDLILQNPSGDVGRIRVVIAGETVLESALENFRDLDFHFVSPYVVGPGQAISIELDCDATQIEPADGCSDAVSFAGFTTTITETPSGG